MTSRYAELMFTPAVKQWQEADGSRRAYARLERSDFSAHDRFSSQELDFIAARDSFYIASISATGWPYVQHRGGPVGFLKPLDDRTIGFPDYPGNRQFISFGNIGDDDRVSLFLMDYPNRHRLKILGHARLVDRRAESALSAVLGETGEPGTERAVIVSVEAFDWNCPQYITPRFTSAELQPLQGRLHALEVENAALRSSLAVRGED